MKNWELYEVSILKCTLLLGTLSVSVAYPKIAYHILSLATYHSQHPADFVLNVGHTLLCSCLNSGRGWGGYIARFLKYALVLFPDSFRNHFLFLLEGACIGKKSILS